MRRRRLAAFLLPAALLLAACSKNDDPTGPVTGSGGLSATIDGTAWQSDEILLQVTANAALPGVLTISGTSGSGGASRTLLLLLGFIEGPGTYPLGVNYATTGGGLGQVLVGSGATAVSYATLFSGNAGSVTISTISGGRLVGTFSFAATPSAGGGAAMNVTGGSFDAPLPSAFTPVSGDDRGSEMAATVNGTAWTSATNVAVGAGPSYGLGGSNTAYSINISGVGTTTGSLSVGTQVMISVQQLGTTNSWGGTGSTGTVTITGGGTTRSIGTFSASLAPNGATVGTLTITNGTFDIALP